MYRHLSHNSFGVILMTVLLTAREVNLQVIDVCVKKSSCSCENSKGVIDLSPIAGSGSPKFQDVQSQDAGGNQFSWNPCTAFTEGDGSCTNVASCQIQPGSPPVYFAIGTQDSATFVTDQSSGVQIQYSSTTDTTRTTYLTLTCDPSGDPGVLTANGEEVTNPGFYDMEYKGKYACPGSEPPPDIGGGGLSVGSILCIVFFGLLFVYIIGGIAFQVFIRKASGVEVVPQSNLWTSVPGLIKDGTFFIIRRGPSKGYGNI